MYFQEKGSSDIIIERKVFVIDKNAFDPPVSKEPEVRDSTESLIIFFILGNNLQMDFENALALCENTSKSSSYEKESTH